MTFPSAEPPIARGVARYVERGGTLVLRQPIALQDVTMYCFLLKADAARLQALCDTVFNRPSGGEVSYQPLLPLVVAVCADLKRGQSEDPVHHGWGWSSERDFGFWVPLLGGTRGERRIAWFLPYLFVDNEAAVLTGRETYGFTKQSAILRMPATPDDASAFSVETQVMERFTPDTRAEVTELYRIEHAKGLTLGTPEAAWTSVRETFSAVEQHLRELAAEAEALAVHGWDLVRTFLAGDAFAALWMVFLKQFRDVADPTRACHQEIVEAPCRLRHWYGAGPLGEHRITIQRCDSHPIADELGLGEGVLLPFLGFWARLDFTLDRGTTLWRAR